METSNTCDCSGIDFAFYIHKDFNVKLFDKEEPTGTLCLSAEFLKMCTVLRL